MLSQARTGCVAPFAGAWIETMMSSAVSPVSVSLPSRERGLKLINIVGRVNRVGVAPFAGAWIETQKFQINVTGKPSLPSRERGLKLIRYGKYHRIFASLPSRERGLKHVDADTEECDDASLPSRERGLKLQILLLG